MPLDFLAYSRTSRASGEIGPALPPGSDPGDRSADAQAALARADAIFCEESAGPDILSLAAPGALVELVAADRNHAVVRALFIARARKLAGDGWRVVWVAPNDTAGLAADLGHVGAAGGGADDGAPTAARTPHVFATALNGLAG